MGRIVLREGDLSEEAADALVSSANEHLAPAGGVDGALRERGGPALAEECERIGHVPFGSAVATGAGDLPARSVIHAAATPLGGSASEDSVRSAFREALRLAAAAGHRTLAVPALGAGAGALSLRRCAEILLEEAHAHLAGETPLEEIRFVLLGEQAYRVFEQVDDAARIAAEMARLQGR